MPPVYNALPAGANLSIITQETGAQAGLRNEATRRSVAQLVARSVRDAEVVGSSPATPTITIQMKNTEQTDWPRKTNGPAGIIFEKINGVLIFFVVYFAYLLTVFPTVQTEDSGELIASAVGLDIAHPPGYPLYTLVGKLFSVIIPFGNPAWRINIMSAVFGAATAQILYLILKKRTGATGRGRTSGSRGPREGSVQINDLIAFGVALFYAFTAIIWGQSNRAEVYTLNTFCLALIIYLLLLWNREKKNKWLYLTALTFGLGVGDHHLLLLAAPAIGIFVLIKNWKIIINPKIVLGCLAVLALGLSVYAYLPIRTSMAPYDNPAFIEHSGLYTWDSFISFVNRKIYGGTVNVPTDQATQEASKEHLPEWIVGIRDFFADYGTRLINNNGTGLVPLLKMISREYFYIPLFLFLPGIYRLFKKDPHWAWFIMLLFFCYTSVLLIFTPIDADTGDVLAFSTEPFMMPAILVLGIIMGEGMGWINGGISNKKLALGFTVACMIPGALALDKNFVSNNESKNYLAYDFNKLALESLPPNAYLISTGRDNMTFPLYYLRKIEKVRPDITLEIYYSTSPVDEIFLRGRMEKNKGKPVFIDLLPPNYAAMGLKPYNFVYQYGGDPFIPAPDTNPSLLHPVARGIRKNMDFPNTRLKFLYWIKTGIMEKDPALKKAAFDEVIDAPGDNAYYINIIGDYAYSTRDFETAKKAYQKSGNEYGIQKIDDRLENPNHVEDQNYQTGMS